MNTSMDDINKAIFTSFNFDLARKLILVVTISSWIPGLAGAQVNVSADDVSIATSAWPARANTISDDAVLQEYERVKAATGDKQYSVAHIMVADKNTADQILDRLKKGEPFAELARMYSTDPGSAKVGGELGWNFPSSFTPDFAAAVKETESGTYTMNPVRTPFGWHIVKINAIRPADFPPFEAVKESIRASLQAKQTR